MLEALGGKDEVVNILADSSHPKARALMDRMLDSQYKNESFASTYTSVGLKAVDVLEIFSDVQQAKIFVQAMRSGDEVMLSLIRAAKDQIVLHERCGGTGKQLDRKTKEPTDMDCIACQGSGYTLKEGSLNAQELYFTLLNWKKQGGLINIDARKQVNNLNAYGNIGTTYGALPGGAPSVTHILKRADQMMLNPAPSEASTVGSYAASEMPEDAILTE